MLRAAGAHTSPGFWARLREIWFVLVVVGFCLAAAALAREWGPGGRYIGEDFYDLLLAAAVVEAVGLLASATSLWPKRKNPPHLVAIAMGVAAGPSLLIGGVATRLSLDPFCDRGTCGYRGDPVAMIVWLLGWILAVVAFVAFFHTLEIVRASRFVVR